jgi:hypothetical protein
MLLPVRHRSAPRASSTAIQTEFIIMQHSRHLFIAASSALLTAGFFTPVSAHGIVGNRVFPVTLSIDDPAVSDELSLPTASRTKEDGETETAVGVEFAKRITDRFGVSFEEEWSHIEPDGVSGFQNLETTFKYLLYTNAPSEFMLSTALGVEWGGTGAVRVGAEDFTVLTPTVFFGKGFGDLPDSLGSLRPFAITGQFGLEIPTRAKSPGEDEDFERNPRVFDWGFTLQYSLPYLNANVSAIDGPDFLKRLTPIVEFAFSTPVSNTGGDDGTTGTIQPGLIYTGDTFQIAAEAIIPINNESGDSIGGVVQLHFFLDDISRPRSASRYFRRHTCIAY